MVIDLTRHRCLNYRLVSAGTVYASEFERDEQALDVRMPGPLTFSAPELMLDAALDGLSIAYLLDHEVAPHISSGRLARLLSERMPSFLGFHLHSSSRRQMRPVFGAFAEALRHRH